MTYWGKREHQLDDRERMHRGKLYATAHLIDDLSTSASYDFLFKAGSFEKNSLEVVAYDFAADQSPVLLQLFEGPTISNNGTLMNVRNRNRNFPDTNGRMTPYRAPTVSATGTLIAIDKLAGNKKSGGAGENAKFWLPAPNTDYLVRVTNLSVQTQDILFSTTWSEAF